MATALHHDLVKGDLGGLFLDSGRDLSLQLAASSREGVQIATAMLRKRDMLLDWMDHRLVALFELVLQDDELRVVDERHYKLVPAADLDQNAIRDYRA